IGLMKRDAEAAWASERVENALLRERINDIASEVARLAGALEPPKSTIEALIADSSAPPAPLNGIAGNGMNGFNGAAINGVNGEAGHDHPPGNLADRIRALKAKASRFSTVTP